MEALAEVLQVDGQRLQVRVRDAGGGCGRCDEPGGCRSLRLTHAFGTPQSEFSLPRPPALEVQCGDLLRLRMAAGAPLRAALASYGLAAALLLAGAAAGVGLWPQGGDAAALGGGVLGLLLAWSCNRLLQRSRRWRAQFDLTLLPRGAESGATVSLASGRCTLQ